MFNRNATLRWKGASPMSGRVETEGRHLRLNRERFVVKGTAYGQAAGRTDGARYPEPPVVRSDLESIAAVGLNAIRTFDVPPVDVLSTAAQVGLRVFVGLDYPDWRFEPFPDRSSSRRILAAGLAAVDRLFERLDDPAVILAVSVGRTLPADLVRVHHPGAVADTLSAIIDRVHTMDPLVPATCTGRADGDELLRVDGCDLLSISVDSSCAATFERELVRLQQTGPAKPLVVTDLQVPTVGADTSAMTQARHLTDRLNALDRAGCAGAIVADWSGRSSAIAESSDVDPHALATPDGALRPLGRSVEIWARQTVKDLRRSWPRVTALVRAGNSESTIERCLSALEMSDYHDLEVIVCVEGSTDGTVALAGRYPFEVLQSGPHDPEGLAAGVEAATGDIVAFIDADTVCHPLWPWFLALGFEPTDRIAVVTDHLVDVDDHGAVGRAVATLAGLGRRPSLDPWTGIREGSKGLAVRRCALRSRGALPSGSVVALDLQLARLLGAEPDEKVVGAVPAAQALRPAPANLRAVWRDAVRMGGADRQRSERYGIGEDHRRRAVAELISAVAVGERTRRVVAARPVLEGLIPLLVTAVGIGGLLAVGGASTAGVLLVATSVVVAAALAAVIGHDVAAAAGRPRSALVGLAAVAIVGLEPLGRIWGSLRGGGGPPAPVETAWSGDREAWLNELRWRLGTGGLSAGAPSNPKRWDVEVRCGLFARKLIVTAVAWQWTPHVRTALRPRRLIVIPVTAVILVWPLSPMTAAFIASATIGELTFELITLRRVDGVISRSITGSLPPVGSPGPSAASSSGEGDPA